MRIALLGTRGIPAHYGGFETFAEQLSIRLVERGHQVTVYCRPGPQQPAARTYRGVDLAVLPTIPHKYLDTIVHTGLSTLHLLTRRPDVALYCNGANAIFTLLPRLFHVPTALNVDGLERKRKKWNALARAWYWMSERMATRFPHQLITDARVIQRYYGMRYGARGRFIAYGAEPQPVASTTELDRLGLKPRGYFLYVSRLEPENNALLVVKAFEQAKTKRRLVVVGDAPYAAAYIRTLKQTKDPRILFPGAIYGLGYAELQSHCHAYIHATEVGGTHPALIEAMGRGCCVLYLDTPENREVAGQAGYPYPKNEFRLAVAIDALDLLSGPQWNERRRAAQAVVERRYSWDAITDQYEALFQEMTARQS